MNEVKKMKQTIKNEIVTFEDGELKLPVEFSPEEETVWLTQQQIANLFERSQPVVSRHIRSIFKEKELDEKSNMHFLHIANSDKPVAYYSLDVIISVGYRVKSKRGIVFRKWATSILKEYMIKGYVINQKRLDALNRTVEIQSKMLASSLHVDVSEVFNVVNEYTNALTLLDDYDHQCLARPKGRETIYQLSYDECRILIDSMKFSHSSSVFGVEKEPGQLEGILSTIHQHVFGKELYPTLEEKAANLLYFLIKDHPFVDGCKRIAATLFLEFLNKNHALFKNNELVISSSALVAIALMLAESKPEEKEIMVSLVMNFLDF